MKWFRMYNSMVHDLKVQRLKPGLFKLWVNLLAIAADNEPRGTLPGVAEIAFLVSTRTDRCQLGIEALTEAGLLDATDGGLVPHNWDIWQFESDNVAVRVQRYRERRRNAAVTPPETETDESRSEEGARNVTPPPAAPSLKALKAKFFGADPVPAQVGALVDIATTFGITFTSQHKGRLGALLKKHGHGQHVYEVFVVSLDKELPIDYLTKTLGGQHGEAGRQNSRSRQVTEADLDAAEPIAARAREMRAENAARRAAEKGGADV